LLRWQNSTDGTHFGAVSQQISMLWEWMTRLSREF
jgi:hypothetical protein